MKRLKIVTRRNLPETNSSSSHSVSICFDGHDYIEPNLQIDDEGYVVFSKDTHFGRSLDKFNDADTKAHYVCAGFWDSENGLISEPLKDEFEEVILEFTGAKGVRYTWESGVTLEGEEEEEEDEEDDNLYFPCPSIDHQSYELLEEITENKEIMKDFIFSPNSWLYTAGDEGIPEGYAEEAEAIPIFTAHIDFGGTLGRVDFEILNTSYNFNITRDSSFVWNFLRYMPDLGTVEIVQDWMIKDKDMFWDLYTGSVFFIDQPHVLFLESLNKFTKALRSLGREKETYEGNRINLDKEIVDILSRDNVGWKIYPISIHSTDFGQLW